MIVQISLQDTPERVGSGFDRTVKEFLETRQPAKLPVYTVAELNASTPSVFPRSLVVCSNGDAGDECLAYCNGRAWFVIALGNRVSTT